MRRRQQNNIEPALSLWGFLVLTSCERTGSTIKIQPHLYYFHPLTSLQIKLFTSANKSNLNFWKTDNFKLYLLKVYWLNSLNILSWHHSITHRNLFIHGSNWINSRCCIWCCSTPSLWDPELNTLFWLLSCPCSHGLMRDGISKALIEIIGKHRWMCQPFLGWEEVHRAI